MDELRVVVARAIHDGPNAQAQYVKEGIPVHGYGECPYRDQYLADADAVVVALEQREAMLSGIHEEPTAEEREELDRLGSSN